MPTISEFYGIHIQMYFDDKHSPHFHAIYAERRALIAISDCHVMAGTLPPRACAWCAVGGVSTVGSSSRIGRWPGVTKS